jgi:glycerol-3-phosphate acyltransferase PlsX
MASCIAVDAMGGDDAPEAVVTGAIQAVRHAERETTILLIGPRDTLREVLDDHPAAPTEALRIVGAPDIIGMAEAPSTAVKQKTESSIHKGLAAHYDGKADAFVSAGNTGAIMGAAMFILGRIPGVKRPSIAGFFPNLRGSSVVMDIGSNVDCKPDHLVQFARMGTIYAQQALDNSDPTVGLLNIGEEPGKGNELVKEAYERLQEVPDIHFAGNVEGGDLLHYAADIIICDGFVGNALLKFGESMSPVLAKMMKQEMDRQSLDAEQQALVTNVLAEVRKHFDPVSLGGAPLLGVSGNVLIGHGSSSPDVIEQMIHTASSIAQRDLVSALRAAFQSEVA